MKPSHPESVPTGRKFVQRLQALVRPVKKQSHRLSANVTGEDDWEVDEPQIRMSRAFAVMLVLHLVAVGGLFAFHLFGKDDREAEGTATQRAHEAAAPAPAAGLPAAPAVAAAVPVEPVIPRAQIVEETAGPAGNERQHVFKAGETRMLIAARFSITVRELEEANAGSEFKPGDTLTIPQSPRVIGALPGKPDTLNPPLALVVATPSDDVGHRDFTIKPGADNPYAPVAAEDPEAMAPEPPAVRAKLVKAEPKAPVVRQTESNQAATPAASVAKAKKVTPAPAPAPAPAKPKTATGSRTHVIQKGDTVYNVAKRYGLSSGEVMRANGISDPSRVQMGQVLKITVKR